MANKTDAKGNSRALKAQHVYGATFDLIYGLVSLPLLTFRAVLEGYILHRPTASFWKHVDTARSKYWDLSWKHDGFSHSFHKLADGRRLHHVSNALPSGQSKSKNLVIFIHGWPDSWMLWRSVWQNMSAEARSTAKIVAVDLPGFGGSDSLNAYGPDDILEALSEFIISMREQYLQDADSRTTIACHDWGAVIGYQLAAEAPQLADRFVICNGAIHHLFKSNVVQRLTVTKRLLLTWIKSPLNFRLVKSAFTTLLPCLAQLKSSVYVAVYRLPWPIPLIFGAIGHRWFLRYATSLAIGHEHAVSSEASAGHLASALGPSPAVLDTKTAQGDSYPVSVQKRSIHGNFFESVRVYREGLFGRRWHKSLNLISELHALDQAGTSVSSRRRQSSIGLIDDGPPGALRAPSTVIWGAGDPALQKTMMLDGIGQYMTCAGSGVVTLEDVGHWVPTDGRGTAVFAKIVSWAVEGERTKLQEALKDEGPMVKVENLK